MSNTIKLGARPKNFKRTVTFKMLDGSDGRIGATYKYRTRKEFGEMLDGMVNAAREVDEPVTAEIVASMTAEVQSAPELLPPFTANTDAAQRANEANADYLLRILDGWDLDAPFDRQSLLQLADELPQGVAALMADYVAITRDGRLGN